MINAPCSPSGVIRFADSQVMESMSDDGELFIIRDALYLTSITINFSLFLEGFNKNMMHDHIHTVK